MSERYCDLCHESIRDPLDVLCAECRRKQDEWDGWTPQERVDEIRSIDAYVPENEG